MISILVRQLYACDKALMSILVNRIFNTARYFNQDIDLVFWCCVHSPEALNTQAPELQGGFSVLPMLLKIIPQALCNHVVVVVCKPGIAI